MTRKLAAALLALGFATATATARASDAYLPLIGPPPMRFEVALAKTFVYTRAKAVVEETKPLAIASTNAVVELPNVSVPEPVTNAVSEILPSVPDNETVAPVFTPPYSPAAEMLLITPQMLAEYFKPAPGATNAAGVSVFVPVQLGFTPPTEKTPPSSRATYKTQ